MGEQFDELAKALARGESRRQVLGRFAAVIGAGLLALVPGRAAEAVGRKDICVDFCRSQGLSGRDFGQCMAASARCPEGDCFDNLTGMCMPRFLVNRTVIAAG